MASTSAAIRREYLAKLRDARSRVQADAEGFEAIAFVLEDLGRYLCAWDGKPPKPKMDLNQYGPKLRELAARAKAEVRFERQYFLFRQSRNDHMHVGAHARDAARIGVELALILEDALSIGWQKLSLEDVMTTQVVTAQEWTTLDQVRQLMLRHAFSAIPAKVGESWYLLSDRWLAGELVGKTREQRDEHLAKTVGYAVKDAEVVEPEDPRSPVADALKHCLARGMSLVLVSDGHGGLAGVVSSADVL